MSDIGLILALGVEVTKLVLQERRLQELAIIAGASPEELEKALAIAREEFSKLDPATLPKV